MSEKIQTPIQQKQKRPVQKVNIKSTQNESQDALLHVLTRIANALEERNMYENKLFKLEEKLKKFELKEAQQRYKMYLDENKKVE